MLVQSGQQNTMISTANKSWAVRARLAESSKEIELAFKLRSDVLGSLLLPPRCKLELGLELSSDKHLVKSTNLKDYLVDVTGIYIVVSRYKVAAEISQNLYRQWDMNKRYDALLSRLNIHCADSCSLS